MATTKKRATASASRKKMIVDEGAKGGFTIIEVVLVLAIAGLIFLMVFLALPALQRSQRDSERQRMLGNLNAAVQKYQQNNNGRLPQPGFSVDAVENGDDADMSTWCNKAKTNSAANMICNYLNGADAQRNEWIDPTGYSFGLSIQKLSAGANETLGNDKYADHMVYLYESARCDGEAAVYSSNSRDFVIQYKLEGSGTYCE